MIFYRKPSPTQMDAFLASQAGLGFTYAPVGATGTAPPAGFVVDHTRIQLGRGEQVFAAARAALERWQQLQLGWVQTWPPKAPIAPGQNVAILGHSLRLWWLNACRIVYVVEEDNAVRRFGYANGTLPDHAGSGEERFVVEWDRASDEVAYDIFAFSRPHSLAARVGYRWLRRVQKRFGRESTAAMKRAVS